MRGMCIRVCVVCLIFVIIYVIYRTRPIVARPFTQSPYTPTPATQNKTPQTKHTNHKPQQEVCLAARFSHFRARDLSATLNSLLRLGLRQACFVLCGCVGVCGCMCVCVYGFRYRLWAERALAPVGSG